MRIVTLLLVLLVVAFSGKAQRTTRRNLKEMPKVDTIAVVKTDTLVNADVNVISISGYDKPLSSHRETFFVTNNSSATVISIGVTFDYRDSKNRQLHSVTTSVECDIPPGETRQLSIPSWDKQKSFYYYRSAKPRRQATPYSVSHTINHVVTSCPKH